MYPYGYRRRGFRFHWLPFVLGFLFLAMLFSGGFHRAWFFIWPLFCVVPFVLMGVAAAAMAGMRSMRGGPYKFKRGDFMYHEKPKRGDDSNSDIYYV
jgi:hypothetical protein